MKKIKLIVGISLVALLLQGCASSSLGIKNQSNYLELHSEDLDISERKTAEAESIRILGLDLSRIFFRETAANYNGYAPTFNLDAGNVTPFFGGIVNHQKAQGYALHKLLKENPDYDFIMYPRFEVKRFRIPLIFSTYNVKVDARLGKLKK